MACLVKGRGLDGTDDREETHPPLTKEQIEEDTEVHGHNIVKGKEVIDEDHRKPFKEAQRTPLTHQIIEFVGPEYKIPNNIKLYDGTIDPEDHLSRFASATNLGEWPMSVWCQMFQYNLDGRANESLTAFKERWMVETGFIMGFPEGMKISSFMESMDGGNGFYHGVLGGHEDLVIYGISKSPELAKRFLDKVPTMVNEMMERLDDFVRSEKAYANTKLPKGETRESHRKTSFPSNGRDVWLLQNTRPMESQRDDYQNRHMRRDTCRAMLEIRKSV
nr:hypothetical protein [Tanacetum cinerariifolium]